MATTKFDLQQFDGRINFGIWKVRLMVVLVQQNLKATLDVKEKIPLKMEERSRSMRISDSTCTYHSTFFLEEPIENSRVSTLTQLVG